MPSGNRAAARRLTCVNRLIMIQELTPDFKDYELLDTGDFEKLERFGRYTVRRPEPQAIWHRSLGDEVWNAADASFIRDKRSDERGEWRLRRGVEQSWTIGYCYDQMRLRMRLALTSFKHVGIFPEQAANWDFARQQIRNAGRPVSVLNLFAYTGAASVACAAAGASVCHVDAAKGMVQWARENARASGLEEAPIRWIVDDCAKFVEREIRRGRRYDAIIMDPPSYGRGPGGEVWKLEDNLYPFVELCAGVLSDEPLFIIINSYTTGLAPSVLTYILETVVSRKFGGRTVSDEIGLPVSETGLVLPCGATGRWTGDR